MEKLGFGALLKIAFKRCVERRLSRIIAIQLLLSFLAALPLVVGALAMVSIVCRGNLAADAVPLLCLCGGMLVYYLPFIYFVSLVGYGSLREVLQSEARIGRGLKSGFARWKVAFYPIPWFFAAGIAMAVFLHIEKLLLLGIDDEWTPAVKILVFIGVKALKFAVYWLVGMVTQFLFCAVAASDTGVGFPELYKRMFAAVKNGWGRYLGGWVMLYLLIVAIVLPGQLIPLLGVLKIVSWQVLPFLILVWLCLLIWAGLRLWVFCHVYNLNLFVDASGITRAEMGLPAKADGEAETPPTVEVPAAPAAPETEETDPDK